MLFQVTKMVYAINVSGLKIIDIIECVHKTVSKLEPYGENGVDN